MSKHDIMHAVAMRVLKYVNKYWCYLFLDKMINKSASRRCYTLISVFWSFELLSWYISIKNHDECFWCDVVIVNKRKGYKFQKQVIRFLCNYCGHFEKENWGTRYSYTVMLKTDIRSNCTVQHELPTYKVYPIRWLVLATVFLFNISTNLLWISFSTVGTKGNKTIQIDIVKECRKLYHKNYNARCLLNYFFKLHSYLFNAKQLQHTMKLMLTG